MVLRAPIVLIVLVLFPPVASAAVPQAFLVQNSGWMEPFYTDPRSPFTRLVEAVISAVTSPTESVTVLTFNQTVPGNESPAVIFTGSLGPGLRAALAGVTIPRKPGGALADTHFQEAVTKAVLGPLGSKPGIIWIFTNNKNSPGNSPETARRNREFYELLHEEPSIVRTVAFPLAMPVAGNAYKANGLMVYALAYGRAADARLVELVSGPARRVLTEPPARLKPLDQESVRLVPADVRDAPGTAVSLAKDGRTIVLDVDVSTRQPVVEITARVENLFYPYVITHAAVTARFVARGWASDLRVAPQRLTDLGPGGARQVAVALPIPLAQIPSVWSPAALSSMGKRFSIPGAIEVSLIDQELKIADAFRARLADIFPGDPLSEVFLPSKTVRSSHVSIPVLIRVSYPLYPLVALGVGVLGLAALGGGLLMIMSGDRRFEVIVDGQLRRIDVKVFRSAQIRSSTGEVIGTITRSLRRPSVSEVVQGHSITMKN